MMPASKPTLYVATAEPTTVQDISDNYFTGHIKLYRSIKKHWLWKTSHKKTKLEAWIDLLLMASYCESKEPFGHDLILLGKGDILTSQDTLSKEWFWDRSAVRLFLKQLQSDGMINVKTTSKYTVITICNYDSYHKSQPSGQQQRNNKTKSTQHIQEVKEIKEVEEGKRVGADAPAPRFTKPDVSSIENFFSEQGAPAAEARKFFDYYTSNGWKVGRNPMKDWKAAARNWIGKSKNLFNGTNGNQRPAASKAARNESGFNHILNSLRTDIEAHGGGTDGGED